MSEKKHYIQLLDEWSNEFVIGPTWDASKDKHYDPEGTRKMLIKVRLAIREKVLESYRNGHRAGYLGQFARRNQQSNRNKKIQRVGRVLWL